VDLSRASSDLYREIGVIDAQLDPLVNKYLLNKYDNSEAKRTISEAKELWARVKDNVHQDLVSAFTAEEEIKLLSDDENVKSAARDLYKACADLEPVAQAAVLRSFKKMEEPEKAEHQSDRYKTVLKEQKEQCLAKYSHFMNIGREDLYR
jgi:hypothetical protein